MKKTFVIIQNIFFFLPLLLHSSGISDSKFRAAWARMCLAHAGRMREKLSGKEWGAGRERAFRPVLSLHLDTLSEQAQTFYALLIVFGIIGFSSSIYGGSWPVWHNVGPGGGGFVQSLLCDNVNPNTIYVGSDVGGFFRSDDGGLTYTNHNIGLSEYWVEAIAQSPVNPDILIIGNLSGIYKSTNGGRSWDWKRENLPKKSYGSWSMPISAVVFSVDDPNVVYAACGNPREGRGDHLGEIYKSEDCGETWSQIVEPGQLPEKTNIMALVQDQTNSQRFFISADNGVYESTDGCRTWMARNNGLPRPLQVRRLAMSKQNPDKLFVTVRTYAGQEPWQGGVYRTLDGGQSWVPCNNGLPSTCGPNETIKYLIDNFDCIVVDPKNDDCLYVAGCTWRCGGVYKSTDGGDNWQQTVRRGSNYDSGWITFWGPTVNAVAISSANPSQLIFGTDGHVARTTDGGDSWQQVYSEHQEDGSHGGGGLEFTCLNQILVHPSIEGKIFFAYNDIGLQVSNNGGRTVTRCMTNVPEPLSNACVGIVLDAHNPNHVWARLGQWGGSMGTRLFTSFDCAETWERLGADESSGLNDENVTNLIAIPEDNTMRLFVTQPSRGVLTSIDGGHTWTQRNNGLPVDRSVEVLLLDPANPNRMIACYRGKTGVSPVAYTTEDAGQTWEKAGNLPCNDLFQGAFAQNGVIYLTARCQMMDDSVWYAGGLFASTDFGKSWKQIFDAGFGHSICVDPKNADRIVFGMTDHPFHDFSGGGGAYMSEDGGHSWKTLNSDSLYNRRIHAIAFDPNVPDKLWLGTDGNSAFWTMLNEESTPEPIWNGDAPGSHGTNAEDIPAVQYFPAKNAKAPSLAPALLILPGGAYWYREDEHEGSNIARYFSERGIAAFVVRYRVAKGGYSFPAMTNDVARAVRYVRAKAPYYGIDPNKIGIAGFSAGGHLAAVVLTTGDDGSADSLDPIERVSSRLNFGILSYPVISMIESFTHVPSRTNFFGCEEQTDEQRANVSPERLVDDNTPPCFVWCCENDGAVSIENSIAFLRAMKEHKRPCELHVFPKGGHGAGLALDSLPWTAFAMRWLQQLF